MNLFDLVKSQLGDDVIAKVAGTVGEDPAATAKTLTGGAVPALLAGIVNNFGNSENGAARLLDLVHAGKHDGSLLNNLAGALGGGAQTDAVLNTGKSLMGTMLGSRGDAVADLLSSFGGVRRSSASSLLGMAIPIILGVLGKQSRSNGLNAAGLLGMLSAVKSQLPSIAPPGLGAALGMADLGGPATAAAPVPPPVTTAAPTPVPETAAADPERRPSLLPWLIVPVAAILLFFGLRSCQKAETVAVDTPSYADPVATPEPVVTAPTVELQGAVDSAAAQLLAYLQNADDTSVPRTFVLDNLNFDSGTARLDTASARTLDDVGNVLGAFPAAQVELQGHTDSSGDADQNRTLSQERAAAVRSALIERGIAAERLTARGFGADNPRSSNDTPEGRAENRRTEIVVTAK
ncbi:MAG TPA: OmpA family protein [Steroidobacteraceae bacterium]|nr:OmpA family protein [Steroidobacteraceae bacterium]HRX88357.1 OmpA family protein [Steroidobacteraceae bacterium]